MNGAPGTNRHPSLRRVTCSAILATLRDALIAGLTLDTFNRHADKVVMANVAQLINTIHSLFIAYEDKFVATPNYHVFEMYAAHQGGQAVRTMFSAPALSYKRRRRIRRRGDGPDVAAAAGEDATPKRKLQPHSGACRARRL